jgi:ABC-type branched-subunit amino acid transport system substrate-binding protein
LSTEISEDIIEQGPLFSAETKAIAQLASKAKLIVLSLTSIVQQAFMPISFLPGSQALQIADYARSTNRTRLAILAQSNDYGRSVVDHLLNKAPALGIIISSLQYY